MKRLGFILLLITLVLITGCTDTSNIPAEDQNSGPAPVFYPVSSDGSGAPPATLNAPLPTPPPVPQSGNVSTNSFCGELVYCGGMLASSGVSPVTSTRCNQIAVQIQRRDPRVVQCFRDVYPGTGINNLPNWNIELTKALCSKGIGTSATCSKYGTTLVKK